MKRFFLPLCTLAVALVSSGLASATPISTSGLTVTSGSLTFSNFNCVFNGSGTFAGACSTIDVQAITPQPEGIQFSTNLAVLGVGSADAALSFNVNAPNSVNQVGLSFNSTFLGMDVNSVTEDVYASHGGALLGTATVYCGTISGCGSSTTATITLDNSYTNLFVTKDINLISADANSFGSTSIVTQTFTATPEPISVSLIGGGLVLVGLARLRKNRKA